MKRGQIQLGAALAAMVGLALTYLTDQHGKASVALKTYSYATTIATLLFLGYDRVFWHWKPVRWFTHRPDIRGSWLGQLKSSFIKDGHPIPAIATLIVVRQTATTVSVTMFTGESSSTTEQSRLVKQADSRWCLSWTYLNKPRTSVRHRSDIHLGTGEVTFTDKSGLHGSYYTHRLTRGELEFHRRSKRVYEGVKAAQQDRANFKDMVL